MAYDFGFYQIILVLNKVFSGKPSASRSKAFYPILETLKNLTTNILTTIEKILKYYVLALQQNQIHKTPRFASKSTTKAASNLWDRSLYYQMFPITVWIVGLE